MSVERIEHPSAQEIAEVLRIVDSEIDDLGIRDQVEREQAEYGALTCGVVETAIGPISLLAARMLSSAPPLIGEYVTGRCYWVGESKVHVKPDCRCKKG